MIEKKGQQEWMGPMAKYKMLKKANTIPNICKWQSPDLIWNSTWLYIKGKDYKGDYSVCMEHKDKHIANSNK